MIDSIATIGDVGDINCWSGIPWHFMKAAQAEGMKAEPWRLDMGALKYSRRLWNVRQIIRGRGIGGYQYSDCFRRRAYGMIPESLKSGNVLSFNQHFPARDYIERHGGELYLYLDATFPQLLTRYGLASVLPKKIQEQCLAQERYIFSQAKWLVFFQRWAADSAIRDCGADPKKVRVILPGANIELPANWQFRRVRKPFSASAPLVLAFIGKDWKRKGLEFLFEVKTKLEAKGFPAVLRCAGGAPDEIIKSAGVDYWGFIDKKSNPGRFFDFLRGCDVGCLFSTADASSIAVLEFLHAGIPVAGFTVDGMSDLFPPDAGLRFSPETSSLVVAETILNRISDSVGFDSMRHAAIEWSPLVSWKRCILEWKELLDKGLISRPVQPWRGIN